MWGISALYPKRLYSQPSYKHHMEDCLTLTACRTAFNREHKMFSRAIDFMVEFSAWIHFHFQYLAKHHGVEHWSTRLCRRFWRFWKSRFPSDPDARSQFDSQYNTIYFTFARYNYFFDTRGMHTMQHCFSVGGDYNKGFHNKYCKIWYSNVLQIYYNPR